MELRETISARVTAVELEDAVSGKGIRVGLGHMWRVLVDYGHRISQLPDCISAGEGEG